MIRQDFTNLMHEFDQKAHEGVKVLLSGIQTESQAKKAFISEPEACLFCEDCLSILYKTYRNFLYEIVGIELNSKLTCKEELDMFAEFDLKSTIIFEKSTSYFLASFRQLFHDWIVGQRKICEQQLPIFYDKLLNGEQVFFPNELGSRFYQIRKYTGEVIGSEKYSYSAAYQDSYGLIIKYIVEPKEKQLSDHFARKLIICKEKSIAVLDKVCKLISLSLQKKADDLALSESIGYSRRVLEKSLNFQFQDLNSHLENELTNNPFKEEVLKAFVEYCKNLQTDMILIYETVRSKYLSDIFPLAEKLLEVKLDQLIVKIEANENLEIREVEEAFDDLCSDVFKHSVRNFLGWIKEEQDDPKMSLEALVVRFLSKFQQGQELMHFLESQVDTLKNTIIDEITQNVIEEEEEEDDDDDDVEEDE